MGMQGADDLDPLPCQPINHQMRPTWMNSHRRRKLRPLPGHLGKLREQVEHCEQTVSMALYLLETPTGCTV